MAAKVIPPVPIGTVFALDPSISSSASFAT
jgi:hypothetical protein